LKKKKKKKKKKSFVLLSGIECDKDGRVIGIVLNEHGLTGALPGGAARAVDASDETSESVAKPVLSNGALDRLVTLSLEGNKIGGSLSPGFLCSLTALQMLNLNYNKLGGGIPRCLGKLVALRSLQLGGNKLTGQLPIELFSLLRLQEITLCFNKLDGSLPRDIGRLRELRVLWISNNAIDGEVPDSICHLELLHRWYMTSNFVSGSLPACIGDMKSLTSVDLSYNELSGALPTRLGELDRLEQLDLSFNRLVGTLPPQLGRLQQLRTLWTASNLLTGTIPRELARIASLQSLWLSFNQLSGTIPTELGSLSSLQTLWLYSNRLTGSLPVELARLEHLSELWVANNSLSGIAVPAELASAPSLVLLDIGSNAGLSGTLPAAWHRSGLRELRAPMCALAGTLPSSLLGLSTLVVLDLSFNRMHGPIPDVLQSASALEALLLSNNQFSGSPPRSLGLLRPGIMKTIDLAFNDLRGALPRALQRITSLTMLDVSYNRLATADAAALDEMAQLRTCDLRGNAFPCPFSLRFCAVDCLTDAKAPVVPAHNSGGNPHRGEHAAHDPPPMPLADARGPLGEQRSGPLVDSVLEEALQAVVADEQVEQVAVNAAVDADRAELARQEVERARLERRVRARYAAHLGGWLRVPELFTVLYAAVSLVIVVLIVLLWQAQRRRRSIGNVGGGVIGSGPFDKQR
jgi:Leucine-rich repeat (LRR) protein